MKIFDKKETVISNIFSENSQIVIHSGDCMDLLRSIPSNRVNLIITSPPYNLGKEYEKRLDLSKYIEQQRQVINECYRILSQRGSICWQVGNYVERGSIIPLDTILYPIFAGLCLQMRNRIIWHFEHGLHCKRRFSGRYETVLWFTKTDNFKFNLDPVRVSQKYPAKKYFKGPKAGQYSCNPLGKNPGDVWDIPNVKSNHIEKTEHPCQFPVELIDRFVLSMTDENDWILDPFLGTGSTVIAAVRHNRRAMGAEIFPKYVKIAKQRIQMEIDGRLKTRPMNKPIYDPLKNGCKLAISPFQDNEQQDSLFFSGIGKSQ